MAFPVIASDRNGKIRKKHAAVGNGFIQFVKSDIQRLTLRAPRLFVFAYTIYIKFFRRFLVKEFPCRFSILGTNQELDATDKVGVEPINPYEILVSQKALYTGRVENAL